MKKKQIFKIILFSMFVSQFSIAEETKKPRRISGQILDLGKVHTIYMVPGMATLVEIPTPITGIILGNTDSVQSFRPQTPENEVTLILKDGMIKPTNLIIKANRKKYIFDIIPSKDVHQDSIEVLGAYGGASLDSGGAVLLDSSDSKSIQKAVKK